MRSVAVGLALAGLGLVAGCSSGSDGSGGDGADRPPPLPEVMSFDEMLALNSAILDQTEELEFTDPTGLPTSGRAVYEGQMWIGAGAYEEELEGTGVPLFIRGQLAMGVDFAEGDVVGQAGNFRTPEDEVYGGTLAITEGTLDRDVNPDGGGWTYSADVGGTLTRGDDRVVVESELLGDFFGEDHRYAVGVLDGGELRGSNGTAFGLSGRFVAER